MEVKIGVTHATRELSIDTTLDLAELTTTVQAAIASGDGVLVLEDAKGRQLIVPSDKLAYVDASSASTGAVGFRS